MRRTLRPSGSHQKKGQAASFQRCARPFRFPMTKSNIPPCIPALRRFPHRSNFYQSDSLSKKGKQSPCISALRSSPTRAFRPRCPKQPLVFRRYARRSNLSSSRFSIKRRGLFTPLFDPGATPVAPLFRNFIKRNERFPFIFTPGIFSI